MHQLIHTANDLSLRGYTGLRALGVHTTDRLAHDDRGEGVISMAIAVLIVAFLGAAMWVAFKAIFTTASNNTSTEVGSIGK